LKFSNGILVGASDSSLRPAAWLSRENPLACVWVRDAGLSNELLVCSLGFIATPPMNLDAKSFLFQLLNTPSPSGFEAAGQKVWLTYVRQFADSVQNDAYGNAWATLRGTKDSFCLMLEAHADEIGFMVQNVSEEGFLSVVRTGGSDRAIARGKRVYILGDKGPALGVVGNTAVHLRDGDSDKVPQVHELFIDIGARDRAEVESRGLRVGHPAVFADEAVELLPGKIVGRAIDNRIGSFILSQVLVNLSQAGERPAATIQALNAVQEEIGGHGAKMASYRLKPDLAIVLDVTHATDSPGIDRNKHGAVKLGAGPTVTHGTANHPQLVQLLLRAAGEAGVPIQHEASSRTTGTDTDHVFLTRNGVPSALVSIPLRYMHSTVEMVDFADVKRCIALLTRLVQSLRSPDQITLNLST
jgi:putative aminopeptidase FrvX